MKNKKRHLELAVVKVEGDQVTFRIAEQTHRGIEFSKNAPYHHFCGSNGIVLFSFDHPCYDPERNDIYLRGRCCSCDDEQMTVSVDKFARIMEAVAEYNDTNGEGYENPWPQNGDQYFYIDVTGRTHELTYNNGGYMNNALREFGNFFRTREEAEAALERVKKALKGE